MSESPTQIDHTLKWRELEIDLRPPTRRLRSNGKGTWTLKAGRVRTLGRPKAARFRSR